MLHPLWTLPLDTAISAIAVISAITYLSVISLISAIKLTANTEIIVGSESCIPKMRLQCLPPNPRLGAKYKKIKRGHHKWKIANLSDVRSTHYVSKG